MKFGKIIEGFALLPSVDINWLWFAGKRHYSLQFAWLWWYFSTFKEPQEIVDRYIGKI